jgi:hypothetical protein
MREEFFGDPISFLQRVIKTAETLDTLKTGALLAVTGGALVAGLVTGGIYWMPFGITLPLALLRLLQMYENRGVRQLRRAIGIYDLVKARKEALEGSPLPQTEKRQLSATLTRLLADGSLTTPVQVGPIRTRVPVGPGDSQSHA